jgi:hypothetical protein
MTTQLELGGFSPPDTVAVKVSAANARQLFHGCAPDYIRDVCHAKCCDASWHPEGVLIAIHPKEQAAIERRGGDVSEGLLHPRPGEQLCPFKAKGTHLCNLHHTPDKPAECISSPFTFNKHNTLIVRNRWRLLKCYKDRGPTDKDPIPAYKAFRSSFILIFGGKEAERIFAHLDGGGGDLTAYARRSVYEMLTGNNTAIHAGKGKLH